MWKSYNISLKSFPLASLFPIFNCLAVLYGLRQVVLEEDCLGVSYRKLISLKVPFCAAGLGQGFCNSTI